MKDFACLDLFCNQFFLKLEDHGNHWSLAHKSFDGKAVAAICDKDLGRLIETWENLLEKLQEAKAEGWTTEEILARES